MNIAEAAEIARIISWADGGCSVCVGSLVDRLNAAFADFEWSVPGGNSYCGPTMTNEDYENPTYDPATYVQVSARSDSQTSGSSQT